MTAQDEDRLLIEAYVDGTEAECSFMNSAYQCLKGMVVNFKKEPALKSQH
jgi:hypothetical protein